MKKLIILLLIAPLLYSCSSDDSEENKNDLEFIKVNVTSEDGIAPDGIISLFYLNGNSLDICNDRDGIVFCSVKETGDYLFPISKSGGDKLRASSQDKTSVLSFFWSELSSLYGKPLPNKKYAIYINSKGRQVYKELVIDKNKLIEVQLPSVSKGIGFVSAEWTIKDYSNK